MPLHAAPASRAVAVTQAMKQAHLQARTAAGGGAGTAAGKVAGEWSMEMGKRMGMGMPPHPQTLPCNRNVADIRLTPRLALRARFWFL